MNLCRASAIFFASNQNDVSTQVFHVSRTGFINTKRSPVADRTCGSSRWRPESPWERQSMVYTQHSATKRSDITSPYYGFQPRKPGTKKKGAVTKSNRNKGMYAFLEYSATERGYKPARESRREVLLVHSVFTTGKHL